MLHADDVKLSSALLSISQLVLSGLPATPSHYKTVPNMCLLGVRSLCSVHTMFKCWSFRSCLLPKPGAVLTTHRPGLHNRSTPLEVNRERRAKGLSIAKERGVKRNSASFKNTALRLSVTGWLFSKRRPHCQHRMRKHSWVTWCSVGKTHSWHDLFWCGISRPHRSNNKQFKNK